MTPEQLLSLERASYGHDAEIAILRTIVLALFDLCPDQAAVRERLRTGIDDAIRSAPPGTDRETIVELRTRANAWLDEMASTIVSRSTRSGGN